MDSHEGGCSEILVDLLCYEIQTRRLSPEMRAFFDSHLEGCTACRRRVRRFQEILFESDLKSSSLRP